MMFSFLFLVTSIYFSQNTCWAQRKFEDVAYLHRSKLNIVENLLEIDNSRNTDNNKVCSPCDGKNNGQMFTHTSDCAIYIWCVHGKGLYQPCPGGTRFNPTTKICDHTSLTKCVTTQYYKSTDGSCNPSGISEPQKNPECGVVKPVTRIVGGRETVAHKYPWMVTIVHTGTSKPGLWCGGSLIGSRWVLTAAHCFYYKRFDGVQLTINETAVLLGHHNLHTAPVSYHPKRLLRHKKYGHIGGTSQYKHSNDIALLELGEPVEYSDTISPVCLPPADKPYLHTIATVIGYGKTENEGSTMELMEVQLSTIGNKQCKRSPISDHRGESHQAYMGIPPSTICAWYAEGGKDSCGGDSGGPLMTIEVGINNYLQYFQIGIVSTGPIDCGIKGVPEPAVYTRVSKYLSWIDSNTKGEWKDVTLYNRTEQRVIHFPQN